MKTCPLCGARAADSAATCFECLYNFAAMSVRTSALVDGSLGSGRPLSLLLSDAAGNRAVARSKRGVILASATADTLSVREPEIRWRRDATTIVVEPASPRCEASLNGVLLTKPMQVTEHDVVCIGGVHMSYTYR